MGNAHFSPAFLPETFQGTCGCLFLPDQILHSHNFFMKHEMWLYLIYKHCPIQNVSGITRGKAVVFLWKSAVKYGGITTGKTVDSSGKTVEVLLISSVISVDNYWYHQNLLLVFHWKLVFTLLIFHRYTTEKNPGNTTKFYRWLPLVYYWYTPDIPLKILQILPLISTGIPPIYINIFAKTIFHCITPAYFKNM